MLRILSLVAALAVAGTTSAQRCFYLPDNTAGSGSGNVIPFGHKSPTDGNWSNQKYQAIFPTSTLGSVPGRITALGFVPRSTGHRQFDSIRIKFNQITASTMTANFASNLGTGATTVLDSKNYGWVETAGKWCRVGLQLPFVYIPQRGNLIIEIEVRGAGMPDTTLSHPGFRQASIQRLYAFGWTGTPPATGSLSNSSGLAMELCFETNDASAYGQGCPGSNNMTPMHGYGGSAKLGSKLSFDLANAIPSRPVILIMGWNNRSPLPIDLSAAGAPGCFLYQSLDLSGALATNSSGAASAPLPIPSSTSLTGMKIYTQFAILDLKANKLGLAFSNYGRALLGP